MARARCTVRAVAEGPVRSLLHRTLRPSVMYCRLAGIWNEIWGPVDDEAGQGTSDQVHLLVDKAAEDVFLRTNGKWAKLDFRVRVKGSGMRSGPFSLLCIYARSPGRRFANDELRTLLDRELQNHAELNVRDFVFQLQRRTPRLPVGRDATGVFLRWIEPRVLPGPAAIANGQWRRSGQ